MSTPGRVLIAGDTLTRAEVHRLLMRAKRTQRIRDYLMLLMLDRYALSTMDIVRLRRDHIDLERGRLRMKRTSRMVERQIGDKDLQDIKFYLESRSDLGPWMFVSRNGRPLSRDALIYIVERAGEEAGLTGLHPRHLATT